MGEVEKILRGFVAELRDRAGAGQKRITITLRQAEGLADAIDAALTEAGQYTEAHERLDDLARERVAAAEARVEALTNTLEAVRADNAWAAPVMISQKVKDAILAALSAPAEERGSMASRDLSPQITAVTSGQDLKPCPFCGGEPSVSTYETESLWSHNTVTYTKVQCDECDIAFNTEPGHELQAADAWNRRAAQAEESSARPGADDG